MVRGQAPTSRGGKARQARARHATDLMHEAAAREEEAYFIFHKYDSDGSVRKRLRAVRAERFTHLPPLLRARSTSPS